MSTEFSSTGLADRLCAALRAENITNPTDVQKRVIPVMLEDRGVVARAPTGTGKTLAYLLPIIQKLEPETASTALILSPTHELAMQAHRQCERLKANAGTDLVSAPLIGGVNIARQLETLKKKKPRIFSGSPGRVLEMLQKKQLKADSIRYLVLDEADRLLDRNNADTVQVLIGMMPPVCRLSAFSATMPGWALTELKALASDAEMVLLEEKAVIPGTIAHWMIHVDDPRDKLDAFRKLLNAVDVMKTLVFINQEARTEDLTAKLKFHGLRADGIHGRKDKVERKRIMDAFRTGKLHVLAASDMAARGLDIPGIELVVSLDIPGDPQFYLHRAGRTGRMGKEGLSVVLVSKADRPYVKEIEKACGIRFIQKKLYKGILSDIPEKENEGR